MQRRHVIVLLTLLWVLAAGWAIWAATGMAPTGDGLVRGFNKVIGFLGGVVFSALFAITLLVVVSRGDVSARTRWLARVPAAVSLIAALAVGAAVWKSRMDARATVPAPNLPVTQPAEPTLPADPALTPKGN